MRINHEQKITAILCASAIVMLAIVVGIIFPTGKKIQDINSDTTQIKAFMERRYENIKRLRRSQQEIDRVKEVAASYDNYLYKAGDELNLITYLEDLANQNKIIQRINNTDLEKNSSRQISFNITANGTYENFLKYLNALEKSDYFFNVVSLHWAPIAQLPGQIARDISANLHVTLYVNP